MPDHTFDQRTIAGMRSAVNVLEAIHRNEAARATDLINACDGPPEIYALATAWLSIVAMQGLDAVELMGQMRSTIDRLQAERLGEVPNV
ncbi:hypothetical protein [Nocardia sp. CA-290969]|uniref:hypothetical protein n=1 Tax=Nocardia sp. CA-290969 TaxID=3239986 RepID=UPI003D8BC102